MQRRIGVLLNEHRATGLHRQRSVCVDDNSVLSFSRNDYLSLATDRRLKEAWQTGCALYPVGSGGSPLVSGFHPIHRQLEKSFASALGVDDCLFFSSGFAANLSLAALFNRLDVVMLIDKAMHASVYDGIAQVGARFKRYRHCDVFDVKKKCVGIDSAVLLTESVFSMSGQIAPLDALAALGQQYAFDVCVDEAHAFGVYGPEGLGLVAALNLTQDIVPLRVIPLGKAFAGMGAIIAGKAEWIDALLQLARSYIYSTSPSPAVAYGLLKTLEVIRGADDRRSKLLALITYFREAISGSHFTWRDSSSPIQQLQLGCPHQAQALAKKLVANGILCTPIRQPTVSKQETGLRVLLNYHHQPEDIDYLLRCLQS